MLRERIPTHNAGYRRRRYANSAPTRFALGAEFVRPWVDKTKRTPQGCPLVHTAYAVYCQLGDFGTDLERPSKLDVSDNPSGKLVGEFALPYEVSTGDGRAMFRTPRLAFGDGERVRSTTGHQKSTIRIGWCFFGDSWENRTPVSALRGPCLSRLTNEPCCNCLIILSHNFAFVNRFLQSFLFIIDFARFLW